MKKIAAVFAFCALLAGSLFAEPDSYTIKVASPNGAPALALATLAQEQSENYTYVAAEAIAAEFASGKADAIIAPVNAGAKLFKAGKSSYQLAAVVTWGNLYIASQKKGFALKDIKKSGITLFGENTINASVALYSLSKNGITPKKIAYLAGAAQTQSLLLTDKNAVVLTAEPALTAAKLKNPAITAYALNDLFKKASGFDGFAQAGLFVKQATVSEHPEAVRAFLAQAKEAVDACSADVPRVAKAAVALEILPNAKVAESAIPHCALRFVPASEAKSAVETTAALDLAQYGGAVPAEDFYLARSFYEAQ